MLVLVYARKVPEPVIIGLAAVVGLVLSTCGGCVHRDPRLPLQLVADAPLPGGATRFDYQELDPSRGLLVIAHMNDASVVIVDLDGQVQAELPGIPTARGVAVAPEIGRAFVTSSPDQVVEIDLGTFEEVSRFTVGNGPDGVTWDPADAIVGVSDQGDGALTLVADGGHGARTDVALGDETGNVRWDAARGWFWITVVDGGAGELVAVDASGTVASTLPVPGCDGAHGLRLAPDGKSAWIACEGNDVLARVDLEGAHSVATGPTGAGPDVLAIDPALGWLYVAAEEGDLTVFDLGADGVVRIDKESVGDNSHSVEVDPASHRVYFPLEDGGDGTPVLRIMAPRTR